MDRNKDYFIDKNINELSNDELLAIVSSYSKFQQQNLQDTDLYSMSIADLDKEFKKFKGNYKAMIEHFHEMEPRDQKLFILYSMFHFDLKFHSEDISEIMTNEVIQETRELSSEFTNYGSYTGCDIGFTRSIYGPCLRGVGYNVSVPLQSERCIKGLDLISVEELASIARMGYGASTEEESIFQSLNKERCNEIDAFNELTYSLNASKKNK